MMMTVFRYETPTTLKQRADYDRLTELLSKMYIKEHLQMRIDEIVVQNSGHTNEDGNAELKLDRGPSYSQTMCDPNIRMAAWVSCGLSIFQQLSGINAIMFYSSTLFGSSTSGGLTGNQQTAIINTVNMVSVLGGAVMMNRYGRRGMMITWTAVCALSMFLVGFAQGQITDNPGSSFGLMKLICSLVFVASFEFAPGPIPWLYMGEVVNDKGMTIAVFLNWLFTLIIGTVTTPWSNATPAGIFYTFGLFNLAAVVFYLIWMKETKGLS
jgi:MFS family permease